MGFGYRFHFSSYNSLTVPLNIGTWECTLLLAREYRYLEWRRPSDDHELDVPQRDQDERAFLQYFRPRYDLASITGRAALREIQSFLSDHLNVAHWNLPTDNAGIERVLRQAVRDGALVPVVNRDYPSTPRTFRPAPAPLCWQQSSGGGSFLQSGYLFPPGTTSFNGEPVLSGPYDPASQATQLAALSGAARGDDSDGSDGSGPDWLGVAETVAGAALGGDDGADNSDDTGVDALTGDGGDVSTPLGDAQPFEYSGDTLGDDVQELTARGVSEAEEAECEAIYEAEMTACSAAGSMYQDPRTYALCKQRAFDNYQACRGY
jgi:hypothetical protein